MSHEIERFVPFLNTGANLAASSSLLSADAIVDVPPEPDPAAVVAALCDEGVAALVDRWISEHQAAFPAAVEQAIRATARRLRAIELIQHGELQRVVEAVDRAGARALLMKGAALAYDIYPEPALRPRADTDLFAPRADVAAIESVLLRLGYAVVAEPDSLTTTGQMHYLRVDHLGVRHACDVHVRIAAPLRLGTVLQFEEAHARRIELTSVGSAARALGRAHALVAACVHRVANHVERRNRLIWLYDIHLLVEALAAGELTDFGRVVERESLRQICEDGIREAQRRFGTRVPAGMTEYLRGEHDEPTAMFLRTDLRPFDLLWDDLRLLPDWHTRGGLVAAHLFPPARYLRAAYPHRTAWPLVLLYVLRIAGGMPKWFRRFIAP